MFFILSKILVFCTQPLTWIFILIALAFWLKKGRYKKQLLITAACALYFFSNVFIVDEFLRAWEVQAIKDKDLKPHGTAIVLGGMSGWDAQYKRIQFYNSNDRLMQTLRLYKTRKLQRILITSGSASIVRPEEKEANFIKEYLKEINVLDSNMYFEDQSRNTHENAAYCKPFLERFHENDTILLVSSAFHLRRASACFNKLNIPHIPYATDRSVGKRKFDIDHLFIPNAEAFIKWNTLLKEWVGMGMYWLRGWI